MSAPQLFTQNLSFHFNNTNVSFNDVSPSEALNIPKYLKALDRVNTSNMNQYDLELLDGWNIESRAQMPLSIELNETNK